MTVRRIAKYFSAPAIYALLTAVIMSLFFELWRLATMLKSVDMAKGVPFSTMLKSFIVGFRFDFQVACYIMLFLFIFATIPFIDISRNRIARTVNLVLLGILSGAVFFLSMADIEFFNFFNTRLNGSAMLWNDRPGDVVSMIWDSYPVVRYVLLWAVMLAVFLFIVRKMMNGIVKLTGKTRWWVNLIWIPVTAGVLLLGGIGRIYEVAPMRWGIAYFSEYDFPNQLALNPASNFLRDSFYDAGKRHQVEQLVDEMRYPNAEDTVRSLLGVPPAVPGAEPDRMMRPVRLKHQNPHPPNVIVVVMESFAATKIGCLRSEYPYDLTPCFDSLAEHGLLFTNFYSAGTHTYSGLFTTLYGTPHLFGKVIMKEVGGHNFFRGLPSILRDQGYHTWFFTTQDPHFDNMQGFLRAHGIMDVSGVFDYNQHDVLSWLGVPDHEMFDHARDTLHQIAKTGQPFFAVLLTGSNHAPWLVPDVPFERIPDSATRSLELNAIKYSDWAIGRFISRLAHDSAFANTLIVVTADNGYKYDVTTDLDLSLLEIPLYIYNTDWKDAPGHRIARTGCQLDILPTVMHLVGRDYDNYSYGVDLLDSTTEKHDFVFSTRWYEVGFIQDSCYLITRLNGGPTSLFRLSDKATNIAASSPELVEKYRRRALAVYQTAFFDMQRPLHEQPAVQTSTQLTQH